VLLQVGAQVILLKNLDVPRYVIRAHTTTSSKNKHVRFNLVVGLLRTLTLSGLANGARGVVLGFYPPGSHYDDDDNGDNNDDDGDDADGGGGGGDGAFHYSEADAGSAENVCNGSEGEGKQTKTLGAKRKRQQRQPRQPRQPRQRQRRGRVKQQTADCNGVGFDIDSECSSASSSCVGGGGRRAGGGATGATGTTLYPRVRFVSGVTRLLTGRAVAGATVVCVRVFAPFRSPWYSTVRVRCSLCVLL
jgi:hypothetical protein